VHHLTAPLRAHGRTNDDGDIVNLWAGQTHHLATDEPAATLTLRLAAEAQQAINNAAERLADLRPEHRTRKATRHRSPSSDIRADHHRRTPASPGYRTYR